MNWPKSYYLDPTREVTIEMNPTWILPWFLETLIRGLLQKLLKRLLSVPGYP